ncbi:hypothetical protein FGB62_37g313 [Gracilaria domingensis]|nr:hypothetical protein FGB62_37g313 [Gracilaria domingensis]
MSRPGQRASVGANDGGSRALATTNQPRFSPKQRQKSPATAECKTPREDVFKRGDAVGRWRCGAGAGAGVVAEQDAASARESGGEQGARGAGYNTEATASEGVHEQHNKVEYGAGSFAGSHHANGGANAFGAAMVDARMAGRVGQAVGVQASNMNVEGASAAAKQQYDGVSASRPPSRSGAQRGVSCRCGGARGVSRRYRGARGGSRLCRGARGASGRYCGADCAARWCRIGVASSAVYRGGRAAHAVRHCGVAASAVYPDVVAARAVSHGGVAV